MQYSFIAYLTHDINSMLSPLMDNSKWLVSSHNTSNRSVSLFVSPSFQQSTTKPDINSAILQKYFNQRTIKPILYNHSFIVSQ